MPSRVSIPDWGFLRRTQRPRHSLLSVDPQLLPVSPRWFYAVTLPDGTQHVALSAASGATIYAQAPVGTIVVPTTPLAIHQAAGAYLWKAREGEGVTGADLEALTLDVSVLAAPLVIDELRARGAFQRGWAERLQLSGLRIVSPDGLARATERLPGLLDSKAAKVVHGAGARQQVRASRAWRSRSVPAPV
jgi:hypothetical protein